MQGVETPISYGICWSREELLLETGIGGEIEEKHARDFSLRSK